MSSKVWVSFCALAGFEDVVAVGSLVNDRGAQVSHELVISAKGGLSAKLGEFQWFVIEQHLDTEAVFLLIVGQGLAQACL